MTKRKSVFGALVVLSVLAGCQSGQDICDVTKEDFVAAYGKDVPRFDLDGSGRVDGVDLELWNARCQ